MICGAYGVYNVEYQNVLSEDFNALLALLCFDPTFKALSNCPRIKVVCWREVTIIRSTGNLTVTLQGTYTHVALGKEFIEENLPCFINYLDDNQTSNSIFQGSCKRNNEGHTIVKDKIQDLFEAIRTFKKKTIAFIKNWGYQ